MSKRKLKILVAQHRWWFPTSVSGADIANHEFARRLTKRGMTVHVHGIASPDSDHKIGKRSYVTDEIPICLVNSDFLKTLSKKIKDFQPDVVLTSCPEPGCGTDDIERMMNIFRRHGVPVVLYAHEIEATLPLFDRVKHRLAAVVTNSKFTARGICREWEIDPHVIYPVPARKAVDAGGVAGPFITFFNPLPKKGLSIAHALVMKTFPDRPFLFVEGFIDPEAHGIALSRSGNLVHARRSPNVASIFMMTKTLIMPSQWEEPFGRVTLEAMYNRIPVIASRTGGLIESVGSGGLLVDDFTNVSAWADAIRTLDDPNIRRQTIEAGTEHAEGFSLDTEMAKFIEIFRKVANR